MKTKSNIKNNFIRFLHKIAVWIISGLIVFSFGLLVVSLCSCLIPSEAIAGILSVVFIGFFIAIYPLDDYYRIFGL